MDEIMTAYRKKVKEYHPDTIRNDWPKDGPPIPERYLRIMNEETARIYKAKDECIEKLSKGKNS